MTSQPQPPRAAILLLRREPAGAAACSTGTPHRIPSCSITSDMVEIHWARYAWEATGKGSGGRN